MNHLRVSKRLGVGPTNVEHMSSYCAQVDGGHVHLSNYTRFERNNAPSKMGKSAYLAQDVPDAERRWLSLRYTLPSPAGRYLSVQQGFTVDLSPGPEDAASFPYPCPVGVVGSSMAEDQRSPSCAYLW
jgi:hypothetical protein